MEDKKADETRVEEVEITRREKGKKKTNDRGGKNDKKNNGRKGGRSGGFDRIESNR